MPLNPDDSRPPYQQVANALRASILNGSYKAGDQLPSGAQLADEYAIARQTVQQALRLLRQEGLIVTRQGSGVFVRERSNRPVELRPLIVEAFQAPTVSLSFFGLSGETLHAAVQEPLDQVRAGHLTPQNISIRVLVPDTTAQWALPAAAPDLQDDPAFRARAEKIIDRHTSAIQDSVAELVSLGLIPHGDVAVRRTRATPLFKLYLINERLAFFGYYPVARHDVAIDGTTHPMFDLMGKDARLLKYSRDDGEASTDHVDQAEAWFDSLWEISR